MRHQQFIAGLFVTVVLGLCPARAENLFNSFLVPSFTTDYSAWDLFYTPYGSPNYPDFAAPFGTYQTATAAGFTAPANSNPSNPLAYWDTRNPTITQTGTSTAFIIGPGATGNIYSFAAPLAYQLSETTSYTLGTVAFQFQTDGSFVDFSSIQLQYTDSSGHLVSLSPDQTLREYRASDSSFGGLLNRNAVQWDLTGLNITSYQIVWNSLTASNSLQQATLDTAASYAPIVPEARSWNAGGTGLWSDGSKWKEGSSSNENGNVNFINPAAATVTLDAGHTVGQITFNTAAATTIRSPGNFTLTANTGITTTALATGTYTIGANYQLGAYNLFEIDAGTVVLDGLVSGSYGLEKNGNGTLIMTKDNTFTGQVSVNAGDAAFARGE
ncbi:MAG: autotransporter-associated beta strand repeat-containing protein [Chthoniobacter sp.]